MAVRKSTRRNSPRSIPPRPIEARRALIRGRGLRATVPRLVVLEHLQRATAPVSHPELAAALVPLGYDRATIYRNLTDLVEAGLVSRVELGDHVWRFERRAGSDRGDHRGDHPHFVCNDCGTVSCLPGASVAIRPTPGSRRSGVAEVSEIVLKGRCDHC